MARLLGIDAGGSATRWASDADGRRDSGETSSFSGHVYRGEVKAAAVAALAAIAAAAGPADVVVAGITGLPPGAPEAETLQAMLREVFGAAEIRLMSDLKLACLTAFAPGEGSLVYAGTGSAAAHVAEDGTFVAVGGKGVIIDDAGGGHWIAVAALRSVLRREDSAPGSGWETPLGQALAARLGGADWPSVRSAVYGGDRGAVARLALAAGEAAAEGDREALSLLAAAGAELAVLALILERRVGPRPIALAGRAAGLHPVIFERFAAGLVPRMVRLMTLDAAAGALRLATALARKMQVPDL
jgi:N-acetylglucosamine kinase-like BadF-type ATPase